MFKQLLGLTQRPPELKFNVLQPDSAMNLALRLKDILIEARTGGDDLVILCIGTDRSTGDALGPLTGSKLESLRLHPHVYGTLDHPVHATNLSETLELIHSQFPAPFVIAVDACLGRLESVGCISLGRGPLQPGAAVNKNLPAVGNAYITGIVNVGGFMEHLVLQSTRLNLVVKMADAIAQSFAYCLNSSPAEYEVPATVLPHIWS